MNKSIATKIFVYSIGIEIIVLGIFWIGITFFIDDFYYGNKISKMEVIVDEINEIYNSSDETLQDNEHFEYIGYSFEGKLSIYSDTDFMTVIESDLFNRKGILEEEIEHGDTKAYICEYSNLLQRGKWLIYGAELDNGYIAILEIPIETINETIEAIQSFLFYLLIIAVVIASLFSVLLARNISKPVKELNKIAKEMGKLNFKEKYTGKRQDEIGQLGYTLNDITLKLETTINDLQHELAKEKQLDILRKRFVAQVSHELQTPLSVINGYIEALQDGIVTENEERDYYYEVINDETSKMSIMVRELLDLSQLESGTFKMNKEKIDIICLLDDISYKFEKMASAKNIIWQYKSIEDAQIIIADELRLEQAITNIINNAFKHTDQGGKITFTITNQNDTLKIMIENEGEKIPSEQLQYIWESFYKAKTSDKKQGTGLGLAIAANIFKHHGFKYFAYNTNNGVGFEINIKV
jgi:signal transduction histidine kinase